MPPILSLELDQNDVLRMVTRKLKSQQCFVFWNQGYCSSVMPVCQALLGIFFDKSVNRGKEITTHFQSKIEKLTYSVCLFFNHIQIHIYTDPGTTVPRSLLFRQVYSQINKPLLYAILSYCGTILYANKQESTDVMSWWCISTIWCPEDSISYLFSLSFVCS